MKQGLFFLVIVVVHYGALNAQISPDALLGVPTATTAEITAIAAPILGNIVYDTTLKNVFQYDGSTWQPLGAKSQTIVLNRSAGGNNNLLVNAKNTYFDMPLDATHEIVNTGATFQTTSNGEVTILKNGTYLISSALSTRDMPAGNTKYILGAFINGTLRGYLARGFASLLGQDYWGTSGTLMYPLDENDTVTIRYVLNNNGNPLDAVFVNIGITKI